jgi:uncharacterized repeat protein (TIGR01451 family)
MILPALATAQVSNLETGTAELAIQETPPPSADVTVSLLDEGFVLVRVVAPQGIDLSRYGYFVERRIPEVSTDMRVYYGQVPASTLPTLKAHHGIRDVARVQPLAQVSDTTLDPDVETRPRPSPEETRARLIELRDNPPEPFEWPQTRGWWDVSVDGHNAVEAWESGYTGAGVKVAVNDSGVDMAHPDFWGTEARYDNVSGLPYYDYFDGWPIALSPFSNYLMAFDLEINGRLVPTNTFSFGSSMFADTSTTGTGSTIDYLGVSYSTSGTASALNPVYHIGYHPDRSLFDLWDERVAVLVVDEDGDELYDTVYVDLNNNKDFQDDKAVRKDNFLDDNAVQGADELSWWDADLDGYPDVSGGMLYFIADGEHCPPFFDVYFGCAGSPAGGYYAPPESGDLLAFMFTNLYNTDHGQLCASNVVGQGNINGAGWNSYFPEIKPDYAGGIVQGAGRDARVVPVGDIYYGFEQSVEQAWWFQALGYDGIAPDPEGASELTDDGLQASSNSFGPWRVYEDGWDEWSRVPTYLNHNVNPFTSYIMSAGNTGSGYGTTGAPQPITAVQVGASTQYGSTGVFEPLASVEQMTVGDVASYSSRGPSANGQLVPHITANGSWGTGAIAMNETGNSWDAWDIWGGTSRSSPVATGIATLAIDAYRQEHGRWPTWWEVRAGLMQGANNIGYDPLTGGTGYLNAGRTAHILGGDYGVLAFPEYWDVGNFRGDHFDGGFAHIAEPNSVYTTELKIWNSGPSPVNVAVSDHALEPFQVYSWTLTTVDQSREDGAFLKPDYLYDIEQDIIGGPLPETTAYLVAEIVYPYDVYDPDGDNVMESHYRLSAYDWTDLHGDGNLWSDHNGDGLVAWDEIDEYEYVRLNRSYTNALYQEVQVGDPRNRVHDGLILGIRHRTRDPEVPTTEITVRIILYRKVEQAALDTSAFGGAFTLTGNQERSEVVSMQAPPEYGLYQAAIQLVIDPTDTEPYTTIVPVLTNVAYSGDLLGGNPVVLGANEDELALYSNGYVRPNQDWDQGRASGGDWRFFFLDQESAPGEAGEQVKLIARTSWEAKAPPADIDTFLLGPDLHFSSISNDPDPVSGSSYATPGDFWGPYTLRITGRSESPFLSNGTWAFQTATDGAADYTVGDLDRGLNSVQLHPVRHDGGSLREDYEVEIGYLTGPDMLEWDNYDSVPVTLTTNMAIGEGITVTAYSLAPVTLLQAHDQLADPAANNITGACAATAWHEFSVSDLDQLTVRIDNLPDGDSLDPYLLFDANGDGDFSCGSEVIGVADFDEVGTVHVELPPDGDYQVAAVPITVNLDGASYDLSVTGLQPGEGIQVSNLELDGFGPGSPATFDVSNAVGTCDDVTESCIGGIVQVSLDTNPPVELLSIPVTPRFTRMEVSILSYVETDKVKVLPGEELTHSIQIVNSTPQEGTVQATVHLTEGVTLVGATPGYLETVPGTLVWDAIEVPGGGGQVVSAAYDWVDISNPTNLYDGPWYETYSYLDPDDDEGTFTVTLPFEFTFFGTTYDTIYVDANGQVLFEPRLYGRYADGLIPSDDEIYNLSEFGPADNRIAVLFGDQGGPSFQSYFTNPAGNGQIFTYHDDAGTPEATDDRFIIQWDEWQWTYRPCYSYQRSGCSVPYPDNTYQVILYPDGRVKAQYAEINEIPPAGYAVYESGGTNFLTPIADAGVEAPGDLLGYTWHITPASGLAWEYLPGVNGRATLTVTVQVDASEDDGFLCSHVSLNDGAADLVWLDACAEVRQAELLVSKTTDVDRVVFGDELTYGITITNSGPLSTTVAYEDRLGPGLELNGTGDVFAGSVFLDVGQVFATSYSATVTSLIPNDTLCNDLTVDNNLGSSYGDSVCLTANLTKVEGHKSVDWTDPHPFPGTNLTYTVSVSNTGDVSATVWITDPIPAGLTFSGISDPAWANYDAGLVTVVFADLPPTQKAELVYTAAIDPDIRNNTGIVNHAVLVDSGGGVITATSVVTVANADFSDSTLIAPATISAEGMFNYLIQVRNSGLLAGTARLTDTLPAEVAVITVELGADLTYDPVGHVVTWTGTVPADGMVEVEIPVQVLRVPSMLMKNPPVLVEGGGTVIETEPAYTWIQSAELLLVKEILATESRAISSYELEIPWGEEFLYTLLLQNQGPVSTMVTLLDPLPAGIVVVEEALPVGVSYDPLSHAVSWAGQIPPMGTVYMELPVYGTREAAADDRRLFNQFFAVDEWEHEHESNMTQVNLLSADIKVVKLVSSPTAESGDTIWYTLIVKNLGDLGTESQPFETSLYDDLPAGVSLDLNSIEILENPGIGTVDCRIVAGDLDCDFEVSADWGSSVLHLRYAVTLDDDVKIGTELVNTVSINDSDGIQSSDQAVVTVVAAHSRYLPLVFK